MKGSPPKNQISDTRNRHITQLKLHLEAIMDALDEGILIFDREYKLSDANKSFWKIFSIKEDILINKEDKFVFDIILETINNSTKERFEKILHQVLQNDSLILDEFEGYIESPTDKYIKIYTAPLFDEEIGYSGRIWKFQDISDQKKIEKMKSEFILIASHQLKTPLSVIYGNLDMLIAGDFGKVDKNILKVLNDIYAACRNQINLVDELLDVSRLEMGKTEPKIEKIDIVKIINEVILLYKDKIKHKNISVEKFLPHKLVINTDKSLVKESVSNYLTNSIKYTPESGKIKLFLNYDEDNILFAIEDNGVGIPENQRNHLFQKFFRADNVLTENFEGTGLGLYYVKKAINALNGEVGFRPSASGGSIFYFTLPLKSF